jgi:hypothetical protein
MHHDTNSGDTDSGIDMTLVVQVVVFCFIAVAIFFVL